MKTCSGILFVGFLLTLTSCVTLYKPNAIHSPLLKQKGDLKTTAAFALSGDGIFNIQSAYALSDHVGVMFDGMHHARNLKYSDGNNTGKDKLRIFFGEAGAGYFSIFGTEKDGLIQCYGGGGFGNSNDHISGINSPNPEITSKYINVFFQPGIAYFNDNIELAFDMRANYIRLFDVHAYLYDKFEWWNTDYRLYSDTTLDFILLEPVVTFKAGDEKIKGVLQIGVTMPVFHSHSYFSVNTATLLALPLIKFSLGVNYTFGKKKEKQNSDK